jgi:hypothetical protein
MGKDLFTKTDHTPEEILELRRIASKGKSSNYGHRRSAGKAKEILAVHDAKQAGLIHQDQLKTGKTTRFSNVARGIGAVIVALIALVGLLRGCASSG